MQSSFKKAAKLRLNAASQSARLSFSGELGAFPAVASRSVAVANAEATELGFRLVLPPAPEDEPCGGADTSGQQEAHAERARRDHRQGRAQLRAGVRRLA